MSARRHTRGLLCALLASALAGCQTPSAVYELAEKTSANAGAFQQHLGEMAAQSKALALRRAEHVASMDAFNAELDGFIKRELYMREKADADWPKINALVKELAGLRDELLAIEAAARFAEQDRRKSVLAQHTDLNAFRSAMLDAANALNALAKHESDSERARFFGKFLVDVQKDVRASLDSNDKTSQAAKALVDEIKSDLRPARKDSNEPAP
jgi:Mg2+ and Co2+ transporter CorA